MSAFGKVLALLNLFGAVALLYLAGVDYGRRQGWIHSVLMHEVVLSGLPLNNKELDKQGVPLAEQITPTDLASLFSAAGGSPVATQVEEVTRVHGIVSGKVTAATGTRQQTFVLARILLPLADTYLEREQLLACRVYLASDNTQAEFKARYEKALSGALARTDRTFEENFRFGIRIQGGEPSTAFTTLLLGMLGSNLDEIKKVDFNTVFNKALDTQHKDLQSRLDERFARAQLGTDKPPTGQAAAAQRLTIARLLFSLCTVLAEDPQKPVDAQKLLDSEEYKKNLRRVYVVCGLRTTLSGILADADHLRKMADTVDRSQARELTGFVADHSTLIEEVRERAYLVQRELARIKDNERKLTEQESLVKSRQRDVEQLRAELKESQTLTTEALAELRVLSDRVLKRRLELRDALRNNEEYEKKIRALEAVIRSRERK
jgi:hypothetical protein